MRARRARRHPARWFHRTERFVVMDGDRYTVVVDQPRFPLPEVARTVAVFAASLPFGVLAAVLALVGVWSLLSWGWGL